MLGKKGRWVELLQKGCRLPKLVFVNAPSSLTLPGRLLLIHCRGIPISPAIPTFACHRMNVFCLHLVLVRGMFSSFCCFSDPASRHFHFFDAKLSIFSRMRPKWPIRLIKLLGLLLFWTGKTYPSDIGLKYFSKLVQITTLFSPWSIRQVCRPADWIRRKDFCRLLLWIWSSSWEL